MLTGVRFGAHEDYLRMVLDLDQVSPGGLRSAASAHPVYSVAYCEFPYRLVLTLRGARFASNPLVDTDPALPFSVITQPDGSLKQMQVFLPGPCEFKVIEIDDPAKLCVDVRSRRGAAIPPVFTVQILGPKTAGEAFPLVEQGKFPAEYRPSVIVLGNVVVVEQAFTDGSAAQAADAALHELGYVTLINERKGNELPQL
jgi:hypothetical protein